MRGVFQLTIVLLSLLFTCCTNTFPPDVIDPAGNLTRADYLALRERSPEKEVDTLEQPPIPTLPITTLDLPMDVATPPALDKEDLKRALLPSKKVSVTLSETVPLRDVLIELGREGEINMEIDPRIQGGIIFSAYKQPFDVVLRRICDLAGLRYRSEGDFIRIELDEPYQQTYTRNTEARLNKIMQKPQGITLVTGPTGSGKTTTLYSLLQKLSTQEVHIATLEDPIEFQLDLIRQTTIHEELGLGFAAGVRGILRMDPDIIFIGEIRDPDTAQMALRAAMTGHQVYSTLHCNDVFGALPRLVDLGLNPNMLAGNLSGIIAQRLVRKICPHCKKLRRTTVAESVILLCDPQNPPMIAVPTGCALCDQTGHKGRTVVAEVLPLSPVLDEMISKDASSSELVRQLREEGFSSLQEDGISRVLSGEIDLVDLCRAVDMTGTGQLARQGDA